MRLVNTWSPALIVFLGLSPLWAEDLSPDVLRVARALQTNRPFFEQLPRYTCLETITREHTEYRKRKRQKQDVLQLDVGVGRAREIYSWPGARTFSSQNLPALVGHGFLSTGLFGTFAADVFLSGYVLVHAAGQENLAGRPAFKFRYRTSSFEAKWTVDWLGKRGEVGEEGEFWVDSSSFVLLRLTARAIDIPAILALKELQVTMDYQLTGASLPLPPVSAQSTTVETRGNTGYRMTVNYRLPDTSPALLPISARSTAVETNGNISEDIALFSHCHIFHAESHLTGPGETLEQTMNRYEEQRQLLPAGLSIPIFLETPIDPANAKVGDLLLAHLEKAVTIRPGLAAPPDTILRGRLRAWQRLTNPPNTFLVGLEFDELEWPGHSFSFFAELLSLQPLSGLETMLAQENTAPLSTVGALRPMMRVETMPVPKIPGVTTFFWRKETAIPKGFRMAWRTKNPVSQ